MNNLSKKDLLWLLVFVVSAPGLVSVDLDPWQGCISWRQERAAEAVHLVDRKQRETEDALDKIA